MLAAVRSDGAAALSCRTTPILPSMPTISGTAYAESWLACRYVAERYSPRRLGRLYAALNRGRSLDEASREVLDLSREELVRGWRAYLQRLARRT